MSCPTKLLKELLTRVNHLEKMVITNSSINSGLIEILSESGLLESDELTKQVKNALQEYMLLSMETSDTLQ